MDLFRRRAKHPEVVPSILQRPEVGGPDVVIVQRPQSPRATEGHGEVASVRGNARRGRGKGEGEVHIVAGKLMCVVRSSGLGD